MVDSSVYNRSSISSLNAEMQFFYLCSYYFLAVYFWSVKFVNWIDGMTCNKNAINRINCLAVSTSAFYISDNWLIKWRSEREFTLTTKFIGIDVISFWCNEIGQILWRTIKALKIDFKAENMQWWDDVPLIVFLMLQNLTQLFYCYESRREKWRRKKGREIKKILFGKSIEKVTNSSERQIRVISNSILVHFLLSYFSWRPMISHQTILTELTTAIHMQRYNSFG